MHKKKGKLIMIALLSALMAFGLFGCDKESPVSGGVTDKTDPNAPKEIRSKDISEFSVNFFHETRKNINDEQFFDFEVKKNDEGILMAEETNTGISQKADKDLLDSLQEVIDRYRLVSMNGYYRVTAGLPPEYQKCTLRVIYGSGEKLSFSENNNPSAKWTAAVYDVFAKWFAEKGDDSLYPQREESLVSRMDIDVKENSILRQYMTVHVKQEDAIDRDEQLLEKLIYDDEKKEMIEEKNAAIPEDYYRNITAILKKYAFDLKYQYSYFEHNDGYYGFNDEHGNDEQDGNDLISLYVEFESGNRLDLKTRKDSEIAAMKDLLDELLSYNDSLLEQ